MERTRAMIFFKYLCCSYTFFQRALRIIAAKTIQNLVHVLKHFSRVFLVVELLDNVYIVNIILRIMQSIANSTYLHTFLCFDSAYVNTLSIYLIWLIVFFNEMEKDPIIMHLFCIKDHSSNGHNKMPTIKKAHTRSKVICQE